MTDSQAHKAAREWARKAADQIADEHEKIPHTKIVKLPGGRLGTKTVAEKVPGTTIIGEGVRQHWAAIIEKHFKWLQAAQNRGEDE